MAQSSHTLCLPLCCQPDPHLCITGGTGNCLICYSRSETLLTLTIPRPMLMGQDSLTETACCEVWAHELHRTESDPCSHRYRNGLPGSSPAHPLFSLRQDLYRTHYGDPQICVPPLASLEPHNSLLAFSCHSNSLSLFRRAQND